jgi:hypothetical protein
MVIYSITTSSYLDAPRGMEFLHSSNRLNVVGESCQQHAGIWMCAGQISGAVQRDDCLAGSGRA